MAPVVCNVAGRRPPPSTSNGYFAPKLRWPRSGMRLRRRTLQIAVAVSKDAWRSDGSTACTAPLPLATRRARNRLAASMPPKWSGRVSLAGVPARSSHGTRREALLSETAGPSTLPAPDQPGGGVTAGRATPVECSLPSPASQARRSSSLRLRRPLQRVARACCPPPGHPPLPRGSGRGDCVHTKETQVRPLAGPLEGLRRASFPSCGKVRTFPLDSRCVTAIPSLA